MKKGLKVNVFVWIAAVAVLVAAVPINLIFSKIDLSVDMTPYSAYSLSDKAKETLSSLDKPVDIYTLCNLDELYEGYEKGEEDYMKVDMYVKTVRAISEYEKVTLHQKDIIKEPDFVTEKDPENIMNLQTYDILVECDGQRRNVSNTELFAINSDTGNIEFYGENSIIGAIDYLESGVVPTLYFVGGHGENTIASYTYLNKILKSQNYSIKDLDLPAEMKIPDDALMLVFAGPKSDLSDEEMKIIQSYIDNGGNISMLMSPNKAAVKYKNFEKILAQFEIAMDYNRIRETEKDYFVDGDPYTIMCSYTDVDFNEALISDQEQSGLPLYMTASRSFYSLSDEESKTGITVEPLIETYDTAESENYGGTDENAANIKGLMYIAARSENPNKNNSKLFVTGTAEFLADKTMQEGYTILSPYIFLCSVTWMDKLNSDMIYPTRVQAVDYISIPDVKTGNIILVVIIIYPILISLAGVFIWMRRRNS